MSNLFSRTRTAILASLTSAFILGGCASAPHTDGSPASDVQDVIDLALSGEEVCFDLIGSDDARTGEACVSLEDDRLVVDFSSEGGWELTKVGCWLGEKGESAPEGELPHSDELAGETGHRLEIPLDEIDGELCDKELSLDIRADVRKASSHEASDSCSAADPRIDVRLTCDGGEGDDSVAASCDTAFAQGESTFIDLGVSNSRWGWQLGPIEAGTERTAPIFAGAAQNDVSKGTEVGQLSVVYDGSKLEVAYVMFDGFQLEETHLFAGTEDVDTTAPGQFGNSHELGGSASDSFTLVGFDGQPVFLVAHSVVCDGGSASDDGGSTPTGWDLAKDDIL